MINVYVFPKKGFDRNIADIELIKALSGGKGVERYTLTDFIEALNDEHINLNLNRVRMIDDNEGCYPVAFIHMDDLKDGGFDTEKVSESDLLTLAEKLNDDYINWMFWDSLRTCADYVGIPRRINQQS